MPLHVHSTSHIKHVLSMFYCLPQGRHLSLSEWCVRRTQSMSAGEQVGESARDAGRARRAQSRSRPWRARSCAPGPGLPARRAQARAPACAAECRNLGAAKGDKARAQGSSCAGATRPPASSRGAGLGAREPQAACAHLQELEERLAGVSLEATSAGAHRPGQLAPGAVCVVHHVEHLQGGRRELQAPSLPQAAAGCTARRHP
jgi:hypothetical protein